MNVAPERSSTSPGRAGGLRRASAPPRWRRCRARRRARERDAVGGGGPRRRTHPRARGRPRSALRAGGGPRSSQGCSLRGGHGDNDARRRWPTPRTMSCFEPRWPNIRWASRRPGRPVRAGPRLGIATLLMSDDRSSPGLGETEQGSGGSDVRLTLPARPRTSPSCGTCWAPSRRRCSCPTRSSRTCAWPSRRPARTSCATPTPTASPGPSRSSSAPRATRCRSSCPTRAADSGPAGTAPAPASACR